MFVSEGAGLFVVRGGGLGSLLAVNAFSIDAAFTAGVDWKLGEVRYRELSHEDSTNQKRDGIGDEIV